MGKRPIYFLQRIVKFRLSGRMSFHPGLRRAASLLLVLPVGALLVVAVLHADPVGAADPQPYTVTFQPTGEPALDQALTQSSSLVSLRESAPVGPFALVARAQDDVGRFATALHSFGYYKSATHITIAGHALDDQALAPALDATAAGSTVEVAVSFDLGPLFHLRRVTLNGEIPADVRAQFGLASGQPALAEPILAARDRLMQALQDDGYALAAVDAPVVVEDPADDVLDVTYTVNSGPRVDLGPIALDGLKDVNPAYVRQRMQLHQGEQYDPRKIESARQDLAAVGVFSSVQVRASDRLNQQGQLPITVNFVEAPRHTVSVGAAFSTDQGGSVTTSWTNHNLLGNAEQLKLSAAATQLGGTASQQPGYNVSAAFSKPDWLHRDQTLQLSLTALKQDLQAYNQTAAIAAASVSRKLSPNLTVSVGLTLTQEQITQEDVTRDYTLFGVPIGAKLDTTDSLFEPTHGVRAALTITPTESFGGTDGSDSFLLAQVSGSTYVDLAAPGRSVLALRALLGTALGATEFQLPPDQRFYGGGSATIRGYKYQAVGKLFPDKTPKGGTSIDAGSVEFRQRFGSSFGAALFVDAGQVGTGVSPFSGNLRIGAGAGVRYYTAIGPVRVDFALPLIKQTGNDKFEFYIGIGEAF
jgi:translocation and assembly module TamA